MAIGTNSAVEVFGTQATVVSSGTSVADAAFSVVGDVTTWSNADNAVMASAVLTATFAVAPTANSAVGLFAAPKGIDGANDQSTPTANFQHTFVGSFPVDATINAQTIAIDIGLANSKDAQDYDFYILNNCGQAISAGWTLKVTPKAIAPKA